MTTSPERRFLDRDDATPPEERICAQLWALAAALMLPLLLSSWLLFIPFLIWSKNTVVTEAPVTPLAKTRSVSITTLTSSPTTAHTTAAFSWQGMPAHCLLPVFPPTEPSSYNIGPYPTRGADHDRSQRPIFCLFDNAKVTIAGASQQTSDYMFETLPFALCPNVVYASVGIADGHLVTRLPRFEQNHGLPQLRQIVNTRGFRDTRILLVLGGREEDAPHFWRLGRDRSTLELLMRNVVDGMRNYELDGVTVHWKAPTSDCSGTDHDMVLSILLRRLHETFAKYGLTQHIVSVMLEMNASNEYFLNSVANVVNYFFIGTNALRYTGPAPYQDICANLSRAVRLVIGSYATVGRQVRMDQLCIVEELAPWTALGFERPNGFWLSGGTGLSRVPLYSACSGTDFCRKDAGGASCIAHLKYPGLETSATRTAAIFLVPNTNTIRQLNFSGINSSAPSTTVHACVLVLDLHRDNYARQCGQYLQYVLMEHFYNGLIGQRRRSHSIIDAAPLCRVPQFG
ncbi:hypothetical protein HPB52_015533 [Rhipicephalus sanguineus]|uniref:GH18 domain-containing protein n=1 Tax=Rhipicephalus sanguineus TaxID=34632 RepID=A0A9D4SPA4_RHISA|nr:hypothetical protein HPB52_015533 [Rhipicephalus sanguineus]